MKTLIHTLNEAVNPAKLINSAKDVREGMNNKKLPPSNGRTAVISRSTYAKGKDSLGVQFWTEEDIKNGYVINADGSKSTFYELY